jgi:hypothetical protein
MIRAALFSFRVTVVKVMANPFDDKVGRGSEARRTGRGLGARPKCQVPMVPDEGTD